MGEISTFFAPPGTRSLVLPGIPADHTYAMSVRAYRKVDGDIDADGVIYSDYVIADPYQPALIPAFSGDILGTIQGRDSALVVTNLEAIASDAVLSTTEKPALILSYNQAISQWTALDLKAAAIGGFTTARDAALAAKNALVTYLTGLTPAWNDSSVHTPIVAATFQSKWAAHYAAVADLDAAITGLPGVSPVAGYLTNEAVTIAADSAGTVASFATAGGTFKVFQGVTDVTTSAAFTVVSETGVDVSINGATGVYTVASMSADTGTATFQAVYGGVTVTQTYFIAKSKAGSTGAGGPVVALNADAQGFKYTDNVAAPGSQTITLTATKQNTSETINWSTSPTVTLGGSGDVRTLSIADFGVHRQVTVIATGAITGVVDGITLVRLDQSTADADADVTSDNSAIGDGNRVRYSLFERDFIGWEFPNPHALAFGTTQSVGNGKEYVQAWNVGFTANNQWLSISSNQSDTHLLMRVTEGERLSVTTGSIILPPAGGGGWRLDIVFLDAALTTPTIVTVDADTAGTWFDVARIGGFATVPAGAAYAYLQLYIFNGTSGASSTSSFGLFEPMVCSAGVFQTVHPPFSPGPGYEFGADVGLVIDDPSGDTVFRYSHAGVLESDESPRDLSFVLNTTSGAVTSGITWKVFFLGVEYAMTGTGTGTWTVTGGIPSDTFEAEVRAYIGGDIRARKTVTLTRQYAVAPIGGGGTGGTIASKTSGFTSINSTTFTDVTGWLTATPGDATQDLTATLTFTPNKIEPVDTWVVELKWQRNISSVPTDVGAVATGTSQVYWGFMGEDEVLRRSPATITCNRPDTAASGVSAQWRLMARLQAGTRTHTVSGTAGVAA